MNLLNFDHMPKITMDEIKSAIQICIEQDKNNLPEFTHKFKHIYSDKGFYKPVENSDWTQGFWTGELWLDYENSGDESFKQTAEIQIQNFYDRIVLKRNVDHHDMGFLFSLSCVAGYKLTGNEVGKSAALLAAEQLISRFHTKGEYIQAWGPMNTNGNYRLIIDCLLNLPLLYWASEVTGNDKYKTIAQKHIATSIKCVIREDYSTWHAYFFNPETGEPTHGATHQGYRDGSAWARGQAWGIYGLALSYRYTKNPEYIKIFHGITNFFLEKLPSDLVPYWDLEFGDDSGEPRDSSSAAIAVCGMLEMAKYLPAEESEYYKNVALRIMKSLFEHYAVKDKSISNGLILRGTYCNHSPYNGCQNMGVDECTSWGDYFYLEALTRLKKDWQLYW
ncbi:MAG: putative glucoronyl hydrolase [Herbinix sp.]|jgi:unsaturated chondroitin disaccharide hydrolase|nr:putative glucoronyl hydrolase [Herbinix sp.]